MSNIYSTPYFLFSRLNIEEENSLYDVEAPPIQPTPTPSEQSPEATTPVATTPVSNTPEPTPATSEEVKQKPPRPPRPEKPDLSNNNRIKFGLQTPKIDITTYKFNYFRNNNKVIYISDVDSSNKKLYYTIYNMDHKDSKINKFEEKKILQYKYNKIENSYETTKIFAGDKIIIKKNNEIIYNHNTYTNIKSGEIEEEIKNIKKKINCTTKILTSIYERFFILNTKIFGKAEQLSQFTLNFKTYLEYIYHIHDIDNNFTNIIINDIKHCNEQIITIKKYLEEINKKRESLFNNYEINNDIHNVIVTKIQDILKYLGDQLNFKYDVINIEPQLDLIRRDAKQTKNKLKTEIECIENIKSIFIETSLDTNAQTLNKEFKEYIKLLFELKPTLLDINKKHTIINEKLDKVTSCSKLEKIKKSFGNVHVNITIDLIKSTKEKKINLINTFIDSLLTDLKITSVNKTILKAEIAVLTNPP